MPVLVHCQMFFSIISLASVFPGQRLKHLFFIIPYFYWVTVFFFSVTTQVLTVKETCFNTFSTQLLLQRLFRASGALNIFLATIGIFFESAHFSFLYTVMQQTANLLFNTGHKGTDIKQPFCRWRCSRPLTHGKRQNPEQILWRPSKQDQLPLSGTTRPRSVVVWTLPCRLLALDLWLQPWLFQ